MAVRPARVASPAFGDDPSSLPAGLRPVAVLVRRHRRLLAALCAAGAVVVAVSALTPSSPAPVDPPAASSLLPTGSGDASASDATRVAVAVRLADPAGLLLLRRGSHAEVLAGPAADAAGAAGPPSPDPGAEVVAPDAVVVAVPQPPTTGSAGVASGSGVSGLLAATGTASGGWDGVVVLAVPPSDARRIAAAAGTRALSVAVAVPQGG
jgi:hypothetical protein